MSRSRPILLLLGLGAAIPLFFLHSGCRKSPPGQPVEAVRPLNQLSFEQLRTFLKGFPGDWRPDSDRERQVPEPPGEKPVPANAKRIPLVAPSEIRIGTKPVRQSIAERRSLRSFSNQPLSMEELSYLLWATQGTTSVQRDENSNITERFRAAPSGGGRYPLETYLAVRQVESLAPGLYRYLPNEHQLILVREDASLAQALQRACYAQECVANAPVVFIWSAIPYRMEWKYAYTAHRMIAVEAGHVCENLYLAAESFGAGACALMGYYQPVLDQLLEVDGKDEFAIYLACVGKPSGANP